VKARELMNTASQDLWGESIDYMLDQDGSADNMLDLARTCLWHLAHAANLGDPMPDLYRIVTWFADLANGRTETLNAIKGFGGR
jgi:hypothetical protein